MSINRFIILQEEFISQIINLKFILMRLYEYLFYKIYCGLRNLGNWELADSTVFVLSIFIGLNINVICFLVFPISENFLEENKVSFFIFYASIIVFNYFFFLRNKKYLEIEKRFKKESRKQKLIGDIVVSVYAVATVVSIFIA